MGLDNGLIIRGKTDRARALLDKYFKILYDDCLNDNSSYEFSYFRKCWNVRNKMFEVFNDAYDQDAQEFIFTKTEDIEIYIEKVLKYFLNEDNWEMGGNAYIGGSIWEWHTEIPHIADSIRHLRWFLECIEDEDIGIEEFEIYWYDSY